MTSTIKDLIRTIPDFPKDGIMFRDITTLFGDAEGLRLASDEIVQNYNGHRFDKVAALEARGFVLGGIVAYQLGVGFVPIRKQGKLPGATITRDYELEYGSETLEIQDDAIEPGDRVLLLDDLIATGGTAVAGIELIEELGGVVDHASFVIDLPELDGSKILRKRGVSVHYLCQFEGI